MFHSVALKRHRVKTVWCHRVKTRGVRSLGGWWWSNLRSLEGVHRNGKKGQMGSAWSGVDRHAKSDSRNAEGRVERNCRNCFARTAASRSGRKRAGNSQLLRLVWGKEFRPRHRGGVL